MPDEAEDWGASLDAIAAYVRAARAELARYPEAEPLIADFERWYQSIDALARFRSGPSLLGEARRRRDEINRAIGQRLPATWDPADRPQTAAPPRGTDPLPAPPGESWAERIRGVLKVGLGLVLVAALGVAVAKSRDSR